VTTDQPLPHIPDAPPHGTLRGFHRWAAGCTWGCRSTKQATTVAVSATSAAAKPRTRDARR
jgi:hypothetical protein